MKRVSYLMEGTISYKPGMRHTLTVTLEQDPLWPLAKAADTLSAFLKCAEEVRDGNPEFQEAYRTTRKKLEDLHMKEVDWFLARFAKSFEKTLDQLNQNQ